MQNCLYKMITVVQNVYALTKIRREHRNEKALLGWWDLGGPLLLMFLLIFSFYCVEF